VPVREFEMIVAAPLARVWAFHQDVMNALPVLSPPGDQVTVEHADSPPVARARTVISFRGPFGRRMRWVARIVEHRPPHAVVFGEEARFVDEQETGPFRRWRHEHEFEAIDAKTTRIVDRVTYTPPLGVIGWLLDPILIAPRLRKMFTHRHAATKRLLET
jgi:ligand-binding SRPBCC domain-containing protein